MVIIKYSKKLKVIENYYYVFEKSIHSNKVEKCVFIF